MHRDMLKFSYTFLKLVNRTIYHSYFGRFSVFLQHGPHHEPHEIAMVIDCRFNYGNDRNCIVKNHKQGNWGSEDRNSPYFPFVPNGAFEMMILVEHNSFKVLVWHHLSYICIYNSCIPSVSQPLTSSLYILSKPTTH